MAVKFEQPDITVTPTGISSLSGAQNGVLVLGGGLVLVSIWQDTLKPLLASAWNGEKLAITLPAGGILAECLFVGALVFVASLSSDMAQLAFLFIVALWIVFLVQNPDVVVAAANLLSQGHRAPDRQKSNVPSDTNQPTA